MADTNISVNVPIVEKTLDLVKDFLGKILGQPAEEVGGLISDRIKLYRFKQQIAILQKAEEYLKSKNKSTKTISLKNLVPLLEAASLEDEPTMKDMYAALLTNYVDADKNLKTNIYPYILSQISTEEVKILEKMSSGPVPKFQILDKDPFYRNLTLNITTQNLIRLGLLTYGREIELHSNFFLGSYADASNKRFDITELGREFIKACKFN